MAKPKLIICIALSIQKYLFAKKFINNPIACLDKFKVDVSSSSGAVNSEVNKKFNENESLLKIQLSFMPIVKTTLT